MISNIPNISYFEDFYSIENPDNIPLDVFLSFVKDGTYQDPIFHLRSEKDKKKRNKIKEHLPGVTFSGLFSCRKDDGLIEHSGFICIDVDDLEDVESTKQLLIGGDQPDKFIYSCFYSTSGTGLRILFRIKPEKHRESYYGISAYLMRNYGLITDPQSMVPSRSFCITYDPDLYLASHHVPIWTEYPKEKKLSKKDLNFVYDEGDFKSILNQILDRKLNICEEYQDYLKVGFALSNKFGEAGREYFHSICQFSEKYTYRKVDRQYDYCLRSQGLRIAAISTFYWYAKNAGVQVTSERTIFIKKVTISGKSAGLKPSQIVQNLAKQNIIDCEKLVEDIYNNATVSGGDTMIDELEMFISANYNFKRNEITRYIERDGKPMSQSDMNSVFISAKKQIEKLDYYLMDRLLLSDFIPTYNPLIGYFKSLGGEHEIVKLEDAKIDVEERVKNYDSPIIDLLSKTIINDCPAYTNYFLRKWLVGIVSAAFKVHSPLVFVLLGANQGVGKTEWFRRLLPEKLQKYYAESKLDAGKDDEILMTQKLLISDDELSGKSKRETTRLKELTSKQYFSLREPYGRNNVDLLRIAVLCGTSNIKEILSDSTGNRRIIPIPVEDIDRDLYNSIDKEELFREAYRLFVSGFDWRIVTKSDISYLRQNEGEYEMINMERELISKYYERPNAENNLECERVTATDIKVELEFLTRQRCSLDQIGKQMAKLGFVQKSTRMPDGSCPKKWVVKKINRFGSTTNTIF